LLSLAYYFLTPLLFTLLMLITPLAAAVFAAIHFSPFSAAAATLIFDATPCFDIHRFCCRFHFRFHDA